MVFLDIEMPGMKGLDVLREIRTREKDFPVVMITAYGSIDLAVEAMKEGAYDFVPKPFKPSHIALVVEKALERQRLRREKEVLSEEVDKRYRLVAGNSAKFNAAISSAKKAAGSKSTILLLGESGTGKELFARAIHNWSERKDRPFIAINCVGLSKELLESELFGYEKGAFTGASQLKRGKIEIANGRTRYFSTKSAISPRNFRLSSCDSYRAGLSNLGGTQLIRVDVIIAPTSRSLEAAVKEAFRGLYRISVVPIVLLLERPKKMCRLWHSFFVTIFHQAKRTLPRYPRKLWTRSITIWPGNVHELDVISRVLGQPQPSYRICSGIVAAGRNRRQRPPSIESVVNTVAK
jgi:DNA-binding NtrC family response regulator